MNRQGGRPPQAPLQPGGSCVMLPARPRSARRLRREASPATRAAVAMSGGSIVIGGDRGSAGGCIRGWRQLAALGDIVAIEATAVAAAAVTAAVAVMAAVAEMAARAVAAAATAAAAAVEAAAAAAAAVMVATAAATTARQ